MAAFFCRRKRDCPGCPPRNAEELQQILTVHLPFRSDRCHRIPKGISEHESRKRVVVDYSNVLGNKASPGACKFTPR